MEQQLGVIDELKEELGRKKTELSKLKAKKQAMLKEFDEAQSKGVITWKNLKELEREFNLRMETELYGFDETFYQLNLRLDSVKEYNLIWQDRADSVKKLQKIIAAEAGKSGQSSEKTFELGGTSMEVASYRRGILARAKALSELERQLAAELERARILATIDYIDSGKLESNPELRNIHQNIERIRDMFRQQMIDADELRNKIIRVSNDIDETNHSIVVLQERIAKLL